jgi:hypothetical protein
MHVLHRFDALSWSTPTNFYLTNALVIFILSAFGCGSSESPDGADNNIPTRIAAGSDTVCAVSNDGRIKCWGDNEYGQLGLGDTLNRGDEPGEMGDALPAVDLGAGKTAQAIALGSCACALLSDGSVKCWGGYGGELGLGDVQSRGVKPGEMGDALPAVDLGAGLIPASIAAGIRFTCARSTNDFIKCWGVNGYGELGLGDIEARGEEPGEMGDALPLVILW